MEAARAIAAGEGPVALDAERASGYRYGQRAYLVQLRREGSGTWLIDPIACPDLSPVDDAIGSAEWILHAATQDLACLAEVGLRPRQLFDTELAGRLLGLPRVGPGRGRRALPRAVAGQGALGRRLVHPAAARAVAALRRPRRRGARRRAQPDGRRPGQAGQGRAGRARSSRRCSTSPDRRRGSTRGGAPAACTRCATAASPPSSASSGRPATRSPRTATSPPAGCCPTPSSSRSRWRADRSPARPAGRAPLGPPLPAAVARRRHAAPTRSPRRTCRR